MLLLKPFLVLSILAGASSPLASSEAVILAVKEESKNWKQFSSPENGFSVEFPKIPDHIHQKVQIPKSDLELEYDTYVSEPSENVVYVVSVWNYPSAIDMSKPEINLKDGFSGMIAALPALKWSI